MTASRWFILGVVLFYLMVGVLNTLEHAERARFAVGSNAVQEADHRAQFARDRATAFAASLPDRPTPEQGAEKARLVGEADRLTFAYNAILTNVVRRDRSDRYPFWTNVVTVVGLLAGGSFAAHLLLRRRRLAQRRRAGLCAACGYDLRETPERCPECGATPAA